MQPKRLTETLLITFPSTKRPGTMATSLRKAGSIAWAVDLDREQTGAFVVPVTCSDFEV